MHPIAMLQFFATLATCLTEGTMTIANEVIAVSFHWTVTKTRLGTNGAEKSLRELNKRNTVLR